MKAIQISEYGDPSVLKVVDIEKPGVAPGKVLVEVYASSLNPFDTTVRTGRAQQMAPLTLPATLGGDVAGVVAQVGEGVTNVALGDKVYGQANAVAGNSGAWAEFTVTKAEQIAKAPNNLDFKQAASLPLVGVSAVQALTKHIQLQPGQRILIIGGTGGIGSLAVQIAHHIGAHVATTTSGDCVELAKQLGADEAYDYQTQDVTTLLKDYDAVFDTAGGDNFNKALHVLKKGGVAVTMIGQPDETLAAQLGVTAMMQMTKVTTDMLDTLRELIESGVVKPQVDKVFKLDDIAQAMRTRENGTIKGKVVIEVKA